MFSIHHIAFTTHLSTSKVTSKIIKSINFQIAGSGFIQQQLGTLLWPEFATSVKSTLWEEPVSLFSYVSSTNSQWTPSQQQQDAHIIGSQMAGPGHTQPQCSPFSCFTVWRPPALAPWPYTLARLPAGLPQRPEGTLQACHCSATVEPPLHVSCAEMWSWTCVRREPLRHVVLGRVAIAVPRQVNERCWLQQPHGLENSWSWSCPQLPHAFRSPVQAVVVVELHYLLDRLRGVLGVSGRPPSSYLWLQVLGKTLATLALCLGLPLATLALCLLPTTKHNTQTGTHHGIHNRSLLLSSLTCKPRHNAIQQIMSGPARKHPAHNQPSSTSKQQPQPSLTPAHFSQSTTDTQWPKRYRNNAKHGWQNNMCKMCAHRTVQHIISDHILYDIIGNCI